MILATRRAFLSGERGSIPAMTLSVRNELLEDIRNGKNAIATSLILWISDLVESRYPRFVVNIVPGESRWPHVLLPYIELLLGENLAITFWFDANTELICEYGPIVINGINPPRESEFGHINFDIAQPQLLDNIAQWFETMVPKMKGK